MRSKMEISRDKDFYPTHSHKPIIKLNSTILPSHLIQELESVSLISEGPRHCLLLFFFFFAQSHLLSFPKYIRHGTASVTSCFCGRWTSAHISAKGYTLRHAGAHPFCYFIRADLVLVPRTWHYAYARWPTFTPSTSKYLKRLCLMTLPISSNHLSIYLK